MTDSDAWPVSLPSRQRLTELLFPRGIRRSKLRAEIKLFAEYLWLRSGACHRVFDFHPNECYPIGFVDPRTSEKLLAEVTNPKIGWARELDGKRGRRRPIMVTANVWEVANGDPRQGKLFDIPPDIPPEAVGRDPRLVMPHLLPLALWEDESVDPAHKLVAWFLLLETGLQSWEIGFHLQTVARELGRHPKQVRESIRKLDGVYWRLSDCPNGAGRLRFLPEIYLPNQRDETRLIANGQPVVAVRYLPVYDEKDRAEEWAHGAPIERAHGAHGAPIERAHGAHGAPVERAHGAHGAPFSGASSAHHAPFSAPILSLSESNLITSDQIQIEIKQIEQRAREVIKRLKTCTGMKTFMPVLFSCLVELGELDEKTLWENIERANKSREPPGYLTGTIKRQVAPGHTSEAYAREVFERFGILWTEELAAEVAKPKPAPRRDTYEERERIRYYIIVQNRDRKTTDEINAMLRAAGFGTNDLI